MKNMGIIQGRLSPPVEGYQECPSLWRKEFEQLELLGLNHIEWIVTKKSFHTNPIFTEDISQYSVSSICADNLVDREVINPEYLKLNLDPICNAAIKNRISNITIPLLEDSSLENIENLQLFCKHIKRYSKEYKDLNFLFEAELEYSKLFRDIIYI